MFNVSLKRNKRSQNLYNIHIQIRIYWFYLIVIFITLDGIMMGGGIIILQVIQNTPIDSIFN